MKFRTGVHCYMLTTILMFIFSKFCFSNYFGQIWSQNLIFSKLTKILYKTIWLCADFDFDLQFFEVFAVHEFFWANFILKSVVLHIY